MSTKKPWTTNNNVLVETSQPIRAKVFAGLCRETATHKDAHIPGRVLPQRHSHSHESCMQSIFFTGNTEPRDAFPFQRPEKESMPRGTAVPHAVQNGVYSEQIGVQSACIASLSYQGTGWTVLYGALSGCRSMCVDQASIRPPPAYKTETTWLISAHPSYAPYYQRPYNAS